MKALKYRVKQIIGSVWYDEFTLFFRIEDVLTIQQYPDGKTTIQMRDGRIFEVMEGDETIGKICELYQG